MLSSAEVLDTSNKIYTKEDDRFEGLKLKACVRPNLVEKTSPNAEKLVESAEKLVESGQNSTDQDAQNTELKIENENDGVQDADEILTRIREWYNEGI